jgi:adenylate cyclase
MARDQRRLAAIVCADVAGYSRLMGEDDSGTLAALKAHRHDLIDPKIAEYGGRIVKTTGDGLLLEFPSVVDAVRCAVDVQRGMAERNAALPEDRRIEFRVGINLGDIIIDGDDIFGDGVNVAARLESLAEPGGICTSKVVRDQVRDKLNFTFEDLGAKDVKNIARPVEVYRVELGGGEAPQRGRRLDGWSARSISWRVGAGALAAVAVGVAAWMLFPLLKTVPPAPPAMSVAVLPFEAANGDPSDGALAEGLTRDVTTALGRIRSLRVTSSSAAAAYKGKASNSNAVGRDLNVRYLVAGGFRRVADRMVIDVQVEETATSKQVWGDRFELESKQLPGQLDDVAVRLTRRIREAVAGAEVARMKGTPPANASAVEYVLYGHNVWDRNPVSIYGATEALKLFDRALKLDPDLTWAMVGKVNALFYVYYFNPSADRARMLAEMDDLSARAVSIDARDPAAWGMRAIALALQWRWDAAFEADAQASRLDPTDIFVVMHRAELMLFTGRVSEALSEADRALALVPANSLEIGWPMYTRCRGLLALGRYEEAIPGCEKFVSLHDWWEPHLYLLAVYQHLGNAEKAAAEKAKALQLKPDVSIALLKGFRSDHPAFLQQTEMRLFSELRKAGIPES